jgi:hypothetical protein
MEFRSALMRKRKSFVLASGAPFDHLESTTTVA